MTSLIVALFNTFVAGFCAAGALLGAFQKDWALFVLSVVFTLLNAAGAVLEITLYLGIIQL